ncbi:hypothetical protein LR010_03305 [Candidatus Gracilibacteria bacterium]|nr:hypothetical protein [Candidatus Gracilibacteria bacterium]
MKYVGFEKKIPLDVSFLWGYQRKLCIYTAIDDASRFVISGIYVNHSEISTLHFVKRVLSESKYNHEREVLYVLEV